MTRANVIWILGLCGAILLIGNGLLTVVGHPLPQPIHAVVRYGGLALMVLGFGFSLIRRR